ncbi:MAG TPA: O-succinylhomoserine sulfhydrylase [Acidimicrobiia bacterium]|nr:O-succinylhomoserine sulfhydrylase [Acidimicrobiia bacterium]
MDDWRPKTRQVRGGHERTAFGETAEGIFMTSGFVYESAEEAAAVFSGEAEGYVYTRYGNPTISTFEERLRLLDGAEACRATASGMAAVFAAVACDASAGDRIVASRALFGSTVAVLGRLLARWGIETTFVDGRDLESWERAMERSPKFVYLETPSNPMLELVDIAAVSELAHAAGARVIVDNVFATPVLQRPLELGADIVVYSTTKHLDGQGRTLGGAVLGTAEFIDGPLQEFQRHTGPSISPFNAWVVAKSLETLDLRVREQSRSAAALAAFLDGAPVVSRVLYPTADGHPQADLARRQMEAGGSMVSVEIDGGRAAAFRFMNRLRLFDISNNLGDAKSLSTHPATTTHSRLTPQERQAMGISDSLVRLSVGLEDLLDLEADLAGALEL